MDEAEGRRRHADELDLDLKRQELELRRREQDNRDAEIALKQSEAAASRWRSPIVVAVLAAAAAGMSNAVVSIVNARNDQALEESRAESSRILEAIKTGDTEKAAQNLAFLVQAGLLSGERARRIDAYLKGRRPGSGAALPTPSGRFQIEGAQNLPAGLQNEIEQRLGQFVAMMSASGFQRSTQNAPKIRIDPEVGINGYYDLEAGDLKIGPEVISDPWVAIAVYANYVLATEAGARPPPPTEADFDKADHENGLMVGLSDYFAATFLKDPKVGSGIAKINKEEKEYLRNLENNLSFEDIRQGRTQGVHAIGEIWGGAFWEMRTRLGETRTNRLLATAWKEMPPQTSRDAFADAFIAALLNAAGRASIAEREAVAGILRSRAFIR